jgi:hypothetical protein
MGRARAVSWPSHLVDQRLEEGLYISTEGAPLLPRLNVLSMRLRKASLANEPEPMGIIWEGLHAPDLSIHKVERSSMLTSCRIRISKVSCRFPQQVLAIQHAQAASSGENEKQMGAT